MKKILLFLFPILLAADLRAACIARLDINGENGFEAALAATPTEDACKTALVPGATVQVNVAGNQRTFTIIKAPKDPLNIATLDASSIDEESRATMLRVLSQATTAKVTVGAISEDVTLIVSNAGSYKEQEFSLGPATRREKSDESSDEPTQAMRIKYAYTHQYRGAAIRGPTARLDLDVDTTDEGKDFIDDNLASLSGGYGGWRFGDFIADALIGGRARYTKALHSGNSDQDVMVTLSGAIPLLQALHLGGNHHFATPPLSVDLNYGYRRKEVNDEHADGRVFEGTATHNIFLFDQYWLAVSGTFTINDMSDRPATVSRTQRLYKVVISQYSEKDSKMTIQANFEDGSARAIGKKVRQYFIGLGYQWSK